MFSKIGHKKSFTWKSINLILGLSLIFSLLQQQPGFAAIGISNLQFSNSNLKINDVFTLEFEANRFVVPDQKYQIVVSFSSLRDSFFGNAELYEGNHASGKWRAKITVPGNLYSGDFIVSFSAKGILEDKKNQISYESKQISIKILGKPVPIPPLIEVFNIKTDKQLYTGGSIIRISFETKIVYGKPNEETSDPQVSLWDLRDNYYLRPTTNRGKPIIATGNYTTGKWTLDYPIQPLTLSTTAQVYVNTPQVYENAPNLTTKGEVIQIQGLVNEIKISDIKLDKENYEPKSKVRVTFSTSASETTLHSANKPFIILTDLERSDLSVNLETTLISGTLNDGRWMAEFNAPEINQSISPKNSYLLGFYNSAGSIREIGPELRIRKTQALRIVEPSIMKLSLGKAPISFEVESLSTLPITTNVSSPNVCQLENGKLFLLASGLCEIVSSAPGNEEWAEAQLKASLLVSNIKKSTITCVKGKLTKKVNAVSPKCPAGYKKK
jgi:hypothetical protein